MSEQNKTACDILIRNALVLTLDDEQNIYARGSIAVTGNRIVGLGCTDKLDQKFEAREVVEASDKIAMPGFINSHNHTPLMIVRGMIEDLNFAPAYTKSLPKVHALSHDQTLALSRLGALEMLRSGCTTVVDFYRHPQALRDAANTVGLRGVVGGRIHDADMGELANGSHQHKAAIGEATLKETADLISSNESPQYSRIRCDFGPHAADTCSQWLLEEVAGLVAKHGGNVHTHLAQSRMEVQHVINRDGMKPHQLFEQVGLLNNKLISAHCVFLDDQDIEDVGRAGMSVAHAPHQNARVGNIAPILKLQEAGANITICTDTRSADMFEGMRLALVSARILDKGKKPKAPEVLSWITRNPAKALQLDGVNGCLRVGDKADFILLDRYAPNIVPFIDGVGILVHSGQSLNVSSVYIDGILRLQNGQPVGVDARQIAKDAQEVATYLWREQGGKVAITEAQPV